MKRKQTNVERPTSNAQPRSQNVSLDVGRWTLSIGRLLCLFYAAASAYSQVVPAKLDFTKYQSLVEKSPFAVATAATPAPAQANFAKDLYIANAAHGPDGDLVTVASTADKNFKKYLTTNMPSDGYTLSNIEWSDRVGATKVTISKDGQFATLTFNQALLSQPVANAPVTAPQQVTQPGTVAGVQATPATGMPTPVPNNNVPGAAIGSANPPGGGIRPAPIPMLPTPPPHTRPTISRNPGQQPQNGAVTPAPAIER